MATNGQLPEELLRIPQPPAAKNWVRLWASITFALLLLGLYEALIGAPTEATMGIYQRIFYFHVPAAMIGFLSFFINFLASIWYLLKRSPRADALAIATAEVGLAFLSINLTTGPIWAKPVWGIWWTWDARLTLTLIIWVMYVSYIVLRQFTPSAELQPRLSAALGIFIFAAVPIDYMAIRWWRTQHPAPVILGGKNSGLDPHMYFAVLCCEIAFLALMATLVRFRYEQEIVKHWLEARRRGVLLTQGELGVTDQGPGIRS